MVLHDGDLAANGKLSRRAMLRIGVGLSGLGAALMGIPILGFVLSTFSKAKTSNAWVSLGPIDEFPPQETRLVVYQNPFTRPWDGETAHVPCWVRRVDERNFQVFAINCTHLGCPVRWFPESRLFMCPCHGGAFYEDGSHASGPPPRGLFEYQHRVEKGNLLVLGGHLPTLAEPL
ncbi:MAG: (2Fe-2S)-binding protein [Blastocatellia bacterium]|nr:MAG: (2Fe-2S)-binding protein [Blastocatellia bacterium]